MYTKYWDLFHINVKFKRSLYLNPCWYTTRIKKPQSESTFAYTRQYPVYPLRIEHKINVNVPCTRPWQDCPYHLAVGRGSSKRQAGRLAGPCFPGKSRSGSSSSSSSGGGSTMVAATEAAAELLYGDPTNVSGLWRHMPLHQLHRFSHLSPGTVVKNALRVTKVSGNVTPKSPETLLWILSHNK